MGNNTPLADLIVAKQDGSSPFWVDLKGQSANNAWLIRRRPMVLENLFYVLVRVGRTHDDYIFFILSHQQAHDLIAEQTRIDELKGRRDVGGGFLWKAAEPYRDNWTVLPGWSRED
jgi:hypothetical protein